MPRIVAAKVLPTRTRVMRLVARRAVVVALDQQLPVPDHDDAVDLPESPVLDRLVQRRDRVPVVVRLTDLPAFDGIGEHALRGRRRQQDDDADK